MCVETWRRERKLIHAAISIPSNDRYLGHIKAETTRTLSDILQDPREFDKHLKRYSYYGVLARSLLGFSVSCAEDPFITDTEAFINEGMKCFRPDEYPSSVFPFLRRLPGWLVPSLENLECLRDPEYEAIWKMRRRVEASIKDGTAKDSIYRHFLENRGEYAVSDDEAGFAFDSMIGGGTRSPHNALLMFLYLMMEYPEWQKKFQQQVDDVVGPNRLPDLSDIPDLPIVRAIVKEGIRYRSIMAELGIPRRLEEDDVYEGYFFPERTVFHANYGAILMDKETYPDQKVFNPARWLEPSYVTYKEPLTVYPNCQNFTPFGYGRRACPGYDFSERTLVILVAMLAWTCDIRKPVDPATKKPIAIEMKYEPVLNPRPMPFPCDIISRDAGRTALAVQEIEHLDL